MTDAVETRRRMDEGGFVVVAALWLLSALAALAAVASLSVGRSTMSLALFDDALARDMLASAAIETAAGQLIGFTDLDRPRRGAFAFRLSGGTAEATIASETARIDLNRASPLLLAGLFTVLGASPEAAKAYAARILAWRGSLPRRSGDEDVLYREAGLPYLSRQGPFSSVDELWLVYGLPAALVERALPFLTVYSGSGDIDVIEAPPEVVASLPGMTPGRLTTILAQRAGLARADNRSVLAALGGPLPGASVTGGSSYRIHMRLTLANGRRSAAEAVIALSEPGGPEAFRVLSWTDLPLSTERRASRGEP